MAEGKRFKHQANPQQPVQYQQPTQYQQPQQPGGYAANGYGQGGYNPQPAQFNMGEFEQKPHSAGVIVGLVLGILALLTSIVPIVNNFSFILALIGFVFALVGFIGCARGKKRGKGMGIASLIINILALVVVLALQSAWSAAIDEAFDTGTTAEQQDVSADEGAADGDAAQAEDDASGSATQSASEYEVTIDSASMTTDYEDNPALVVNYTWTNNSDEATSFAVAFDETCFQNGVEREMAIVSDVDTSNYMNEVQPGSSAEVTLCYELEDESEVTVEVKELFNLDDTVLAEKSFDPATL